jgi:dienelactone hydrolase
MKRLSMLGSVLVCLLIACGGAGDGGGGAEEAAGEVEEAVGGAEGGTGGAEDTAGEADVARTSEETTSLVQSRADPGFRSETVTFTTEDGVSIVATLMQPHTVEGRVPAVVLIHQGGSSREEWAPYAHTLPAAGYVALAYDVRGHGDSDSVPDLRGLFDDPLLAPKDLAAAIAMLRAMPVVDGERIAVVGASIGSNLACMSIDAFGVKTAVAISGKTSAVFNLAGREDIRLRSIFHIATKQDGSGNRARWAQELYDRTEDPREIYIAADDAHGVKILRNEPELWYRIMSWLEATL